MSSHAITLIGYGVILLGGIALDRASRRPGSSIPTLDRMVAWTLHTRSGRIGLFSAWAWLGLHFLG